MNPSTTEEPLIDLAQEPEIAPRLRRRLVERAKEIVEADDASDATRERLRSELAEHEQRIADAERELGAATLDDSDQREAVERLQTARDDAKRVEAAIAELDRREDEGRRDAWNAAVSAERIRGYRWFVDYLDLVADCKRKQAAADEAAERLREIGELASIRNFQTGLWGLPTETLFDDELLGATSPRPLSAREERRRLGESPLDRLTVEECERLRKKAESLAAAEERYEPMQTDKSAVPEGT
jgi:hypothetical protein